MFYYYTFSNILVFSFAFIFLVVFIIIIFINFKNMPKFVKFKSLDFFAEIYNLKKNKNHYKGIYSDINIQLFLGKKKNSDLLNIILTPIKKTFCLTIKSGKKNEKDIFLNDSLFDNLVNLDSNDIKRTFGLMSYETRNILIELISKFSSFSINEKSCRITISYVQFDIFQKYMDKIILLLNRLISDISTEKLLILNIEYDPVIEFRIKCLNYFIEIPESKNNTSFFKKLFNSENELSIIALQQLGEKGLDNVNVLLNKNDIVYMEKYLTYLRNFPNNPHVISSVLKQLKSTDSKILFLIVKFLNEINYNKVPDEIKSFIENEFLLVNEPELSKQLILFCGRLKIEDSVPFLIKKINSSNSEIVLTTLESFRLFDRIDYVEYILPLTKGFTPAEVKQKALKTIDELQKNVSKDLKGTLSVADISSEEGNLSIVNDDGDGGKLSLE